MDTNKVVEIIAQLQEEVERLSINISSENAAQTGGWSVV